MEDKTLLFSNAILCISSFSGAGKKISGLIPSYNGPNGLSKVKLHKFKPIWVFGCLQSIGISITGDLVVRLMVLFGSVDDVSPNTTYQIRNTALIGPLDLHSNPKVGKQIWLH